MRQKRASCRRAGVRGAIPAVAVGVGLPADERRVDISARASARIGATNSAAPGLAWNDARARRRLLSPPM